MMRYPIWLVIAASFVAGCDQGKPAHAQTGEAPATQPAEPAKPTEVQLTKDAIAESHVEVAPAGKRVLTPVISAPARLEFNAGAMARVGASVPGRVAELKVQLGSDVQKADELVIVESPDLGEAQSDYLQKKTAVVAASAAVEPAKISAERGRALFEENQSVALGEVQKREAEYKSAQAAAQSAKAAVTAALNKLSLMGMPAAAIKELEETGKLTPRYAIRTPLAGQVIQCDVTLGALVGPDKDLAIEVADVSKVWVLADVPESQYAQVRKGAAARVTVPALGAQAVEGKLTLLAPALDPAMRTLQVRIEVPNPDGELRPGMLATAQIESATSNAEAVLALPADAIMPIDGEPTIFLAVKGADTKFKRQAVSVGPTVGGWTAIKDGLKEGDPVVVRGAFILKAQLSKPAEE
jgi:membrane fusion protein, heavy metal efflux system